MPSSHLTSSKQARRSLGVGEGGREGGGSRGSGGKRDKGEGRREGEECARNFAPIFAFHMRINTTEYRRHELDKSL